MGYYIQVDLNGVPLPEKGKAEALINSGAKVVVGSSDLIFDLVFKKDLVCVVENRFFDAAGYAFDEQEMKEFMYPDGRKRTWLIVENAKQLSGYED